MPKLPHYKRVYEILRRQISDGTYVVGELLPSENELCQVYGLTRPTIRKALDLLTVDDYIIKHHGKGSIVKGQSKGIGILSLLSTTSAVGQMNMQTKIILKPELRQWDEAFTYTIPDAYRNVGCIYFERLRVVDGVPVIFDITMLPNNIKGFIQHSMENQSLFNLLRSEYGITVKGGTQNLFAIGATKQLKELLGVRTGFPLLQMDRKIETSSDNFHIYSQLFYLTQNYSLTGIF